MNIVLFAEKTVVSDLTTAQVVGAVARERFVPVLAVKFVAVAVDVARAIFVAAVDLECVAILSAVVYSIVVDQVAVVSPAAAPFVTGRVVVVVAGLW